MVLGRFQPTSSSLFPKILTEGTITTEARNLFQHLIILTEKANSLVWLGRLRRGESKFQSTFNQPVTVLNAAFRSARTNRRCKEWRPSHCILSSWEGLGCQSSSVHGATFKLGRHTKFALWRLITTSRNSAFTRGF